MLNFLYDYTSTTHHSVEILITFLLLFLIGCMIGYVIELFFRRFVTAKKWVNPGFMRGPWLPLYGFGVVLMFFLSWCIISLFPDSWLFYNPHGNLFDNSNQSLATIYDLIPICSIALGMILLEFIAGLIFVKGFKVRLWDYTNMKGNILGIICPQFSLIWFICAVIYYYALNPFVYEAFSYSFSYMFGGSDSSKAAHFGFIFVLGIAYGVFFIDLIKSIGLFNRIAKLAKSSGIIARYEKMKEDTKKQKEYYKEKIIEALPESLKKNKEKEFIGASKKKFVNFMRKIVLIEPNKKKNDNYDENGRPKKEDVNTSSTD